MPFDVEITIDSKINYRHRVSPGKAPTRISHSDFNLELVSFASQSLRETLSLTIETKDWVDRLLVGAYEGLKWGPNSISFVHASVLLKDGEKTVREWSVNGVDIQATISTVDSRRSYFSSEI